MVVTALAAAMTACSADETGDDENVATPRSEQSGAEPDEDRWGPLPPPNLEDRKDLRDPDLPDRLGRFVAEEPTVDVGSISLFYDDAANYASALTTIQLGTHHYQRIVEGITAPAVHGDAVCGVEAKDDTGISCVVAGEFATLWVLGTAGEMTVEQLARFTNRLYDAL